MIRSRRQRAGPAATSRRSRDLSIKPDKFRDVFLSDRLSQERTAVLAAIQRPVNAQALGEPLGTPARRSRGRSPSPTRSHTSILQRIDLADVVVGSDRVAYAKPGTNAAR